MNAMWVSLKDNMHCCKITDVARLHAKLVRRNRSSSAETKLKNEATDGDENPFLQHKFRHCYFRNRFHELENGDPSRNIIEMIFRGSSANPTKKIKRVIKVNNSPDILEKFEKYRETVKTISCEHHKIHPRSTVDGNELLQFYGTTMRCCGKKTHQVSELCRDPTCRVCRIIQSGFNTSYNKKQGIRLGTNSEEMSEDMTGISKNAKKAVIVCRTIAGGIVDTEDEYDSVENGLYTKNESITLRNPSAVLPCFIIVF
ncbi:hypothetical protein BUALT_Bualt03G0108100 [Buddleja alternifolia]|uniref:Uncharacterized protein n=1 Tax=Buddleja alternifolia TaxID=168488 RepID=A0AAV6Y036_9LAMI|nr:hypothetical protein BUALT_Bualt03G0108100 [Buddleja alternifolia]